MKNKLLFLQTFLLLCGTIFAWINVTIDFAKFYDNEGTIFKISNCVLPNPVTTACFWGAIAFFVSLNISFLIIRNKAELKLQNILFWLLLSGTIFAWANFGLTLFNYFSNINKGPTRGCSGQLVTNPIATPCFTGAVLYLAAFLVALAIRKKLT